MRYENRPVDYVMRSKTVNGEVDSCAKHTHAMTVKHVAVHVIERAAATARIVVDWFMRQERLFNGVVYHVALLVGQVHGLHPNILSVYRSLYICGSTRSRAAAYNV